MAKGEGKQRFCLPVLKMIIIALSDWSPELSWCSIDLALPVLHLGRKMKDSFAISAVGWDSEDGGQTCFMTLGRSLPP